MVDLFLWSNYREVGPSRSRFVPASVALGEDQMRIWDQWKNCPIFVGHRKSDGTIHWGGTGFFIEVPFRLTAELSFYYFVTASHVADTFENRPFVMRVNTRDGECAIVEFSAEVVWHRHPSKDSDVAIMGCHLDDAKFEYLTSPLSMLLTEPYAKSGTVGIGDQIMTIGLFARHTGIKRNVPLCRLGNLSVFPDELVPGVKVGIDFSTGDAKRAAINAYLVEVRSTGGLSGSPVFVKPTVQLPYNYLCAQGHQHSTMVQTENANGYILGLAQGHWEIDPKDKNNFVVGGGREESINLGIALVVPAYIIIEVLNQPTLLVERMKIESDFQNSLPTSEIDFNGLPVGKRRSPQQLPS
jgi:hypothetical protein